MPDKIFQGYDIIRLDLHAARPHDFQVIELVDRLFIGRMVSARIDDEADIRMAAHDICQPLAKPLRVMDAPDDLVVDQDYRDLAQDLFQPRKKALFGRR